MQKRYSNRGMKPDHIIIDEAGNVPDTVFFFPKADGGPVAVRAKSREEAEEKLAANKKGDE